MNPPLCNAEVTGSIPVGSMDCTRSNRVQDRHTVLDALRSRVLPLPATNPGTSYRAATQAPSTQVTHPLEERACPRRLPGLRPNPVDKLDAGDRPASSHEQTPFLQIGEAALILEVARRAAMGREAVPRTTCGWRSRGSPGFI